MRAIVRGRSADPIGLGLRSRGNPDPTTTEEACHAERCLDVSGTRVSSGYDATSGRDLSGYHVEALDGSIGKIDEATYEVGKSFIIVDTGPWIFGRKVMLPAGVDRSRRRGRREGLGEPDQGADQGFPGVRRVDDLGCGLPRRGRELLRRRRSRAPRLRPPRLAHAQTRSEEPRQLPGLHCVFGVSSSGRRPERVERWRSRRIRAAAGSAPTIRTAPAPRARAGRAATASSQRARTRAR